MRHVGVSFSYGAKSGQAWPKAYEMTSLFRLDLRSISDLVSRAYNVLFSALGKGSNHQFPDLSRETQNHERLILRSAPGSPELRSIANCSIAASGSRQN